MMAMTRFFLLGPVLLVFLAGLWGLWGVLDAYARGLAIGAVGVGLALVGGALLIGRSVQQGAALDALDDLDELDGDELPMLPPPTVRVVRVEKPMPKQLTGGNR